MLGNGRGGPEPGSFSICAGCSAVNEFAEKEEGVLTLIPANLSRISPEDRERLERLQRVIADRRN